MSVFSSPNDVQGAVDSLWNACLEKLEKTVPRPAFEMCLRGSRATSVGPRRMNVILPHGYAFEQVLGRQRSLIDTARRVLAEVDGEGWDVQWAAPSREEEETRAAARDPEPALDVSVRRLTSTPTAPARRPAVPSQDEDGPAENPRFTFDRLVSGPSNQLAVQAARQAAEQPGRTFNPLVIYGDVGLGKTHLMLALKHLLRQTRPRTRVVYTSSETFTNELVEAFQERRVPAFRKKYRQVDLLMVEDVEFLIGKERIQEEFYHTFEQLAASGHQVILTCDRPPQLLTQLQDRLCSRLSSGLIADIGPPTLEMRKQILRQRASESQAVLSDEVVDYIAESFSGSVRNLEGALVRVLASAQAVGERVIKLALVQRALACITPPRSTRPRVLTLTDILDKVSHYYHVEVDDLLGARRDRRFSTPRHIAMYLAQELARMRCREISEAFGGRDYSTVTHAIKKISSQCDQPNLRNDINHLKGLLGA